MRKLDTNELQHVYGGGSKDCRSGSKGKSKSKSKSKSNCKSKSKTRSCH